MKKFLLILCLVCAGCFSSGQGCRAQGAYDVFVPISKYLNAADVESLSAWFAPTLEVAVLGRPNECSKKQAKQILKSFFKTYPPRNFTISHTAGRENLKYALGELTAGGEHFIVTIFVSCPTEGSFRIQQLKIDRME